MNKEILKFCLEKGFLVENDLLELFSDSSDIESVKLIIEKVKSYTNQNILTKDFFKKNKDKIEGVFFKLPKENAKKILKKINAAISKVLKEK